MLTFLSCSDDNENLETKDPIIGKWGLIKDLEEGVDKINECSSKSALEFLENGDCYREFFNKQNNDCLSDGKDKAKWEKKDNLYAIIEERQSTPEFMEIKFNNNNSEFTTPEGNIWKRK